MRAKSVPSSASLRVEVGSVHVSSMEEDSSNVGSSGGSTGGSWIFLGGNNSNSVLWRVASCEDQGFVCSSACNK